MTLAPPSMRGLFHWQSLSRYAAPRVMKTGGIPAAQVSACRLMALGLSIESGRWKPALRQASRFRRVSAGGASRVCDLRGELLILLLDVLLQLRQEVGLRSLRRRERPDAELLEDALDLVQSSGAEDRPGPGPERLALLVEGEPVAKLLV